jgi:hypothetical protein
VNEQQVVAVERPVGRFTAGVLALYALSGIGAVFAWLLGTDEKFRVLMFGDPSLFSAIATAVLSVALLTGAVLHHSEKVYELDFFEIALSIGFKIFSVFLAGGLGAWCLLGEEGLAFRGLGWCILAMGAALAVVSYVWLVRRTSFLLGTLLFLTVTFWVGLFSIILVMLLGDRGKKAKAA